MLTDVGKLALHAVLGVAPQLERSSFLINMSSISSPVVLNIPIRAGQWEDSVEWYWKVCLNKTSAGFQSQTRTIFQRGVLLSWFWRSVPSQPTYLSQSLCLYQIKNWDSVVNKHGVGYTQLLKTFHASVSLFTNSPLLGNTLIWTR